MKRYKGILKMVGICVLAFIIGMCIEYIRPLRKTDIPNIPIGDFEIYQSFCLTSGEYKDTSIRVIVNKEDYDIETMFEEVREFHNNLNGEPDELEISLYSSRDDIKNHNCIGSKTYYKE